MSEPVLLPAESIAVTVARAQLRRGENPEINMTDVLLMTVDRLRFQIEDFRAAVDAALELANGDFCPIPDDVKNMRGRAGWHFAMDHIRAALAPVADPDPHTTSDEETT
jgi:hypothetical protein